MSYDARSWTFLSNHGHVLLCLARDPERRMRDIADEVGITERSVQRIISDLEAGGCLVREKVGRRNSYRVVPGAPLRHALEQHRTVGDLIELVVADAGAPSDV